MGVIPADCVGMVQHPLNFRGEEGKQGHCEKQKPTAILQEQPTDEHYKTSCMEGLGAWEQVIGRRFATVVGPDDLSDDKQWPPFDLLKEPTQCRKS